MAKLQMSEKNKSELQASYENFFGKDSTSYSEKSKALSRKVYVYGFIIAVLVFALAFIPKLLLENITCLPASTDILPEFVRLASEKVRFALTVKLPEISEFDDEAPEMVNGLLTKTKPPDCKFIDFTEAVASIVKNEPLGITISSPDCGTPDGDHEDAVLKLTAPACEVFVSP